MVSLFMGLVGFGLGLLFGWLLHRERVARVEYEGAAQDSRATATLAETSARLELADQDMVNLRAQLTDAQHLLDERDAVIAQLEAELTAYRDPASEEVTTEVPGVEPEAGAFEVDETDVTDELLAPMEANDEEPVVDEVVVDETTLVTEPEPVVEEAEPEPVVGEEPELEAEEQVVEAEPVVEEPPVAAEEPPVAEPEPAAEPDELRRIRGLGPAMERSLNEQGIVTFRQIANLDDAAIEKLEAQLTGISGRIRRNNWIEQARDLHIETHGDQP